jgi:SNF2 family DNA or RNA helicase
MKKIQLFKHQKEALKRVLKNPYYALFMEQGTGKTLVAIKAIEKRYKEGKLTRVLIFVPKTIVFNWQEEIERFLSIPKKSYRVEVLDERKKEKQIEALKNFYKLDPSKLTVKQLRTMTEAPKKATKTEMLRNIPQKLQILVINYQKSWVLNKELKKYKPQMLVIDESHKLKNRNADISKNIHRLTRECDYRIIMTGTPICNGYEDIFMQFKILDDNILGSNYGDFEEDYVVKGGYMNYQITGYQNIEDLDRIIQENAYRVKIEECIDLPEQIPDLYLTCELNPKARKLYNELDKEMVVELDLLQENLPRKELKSILKNHEVKYSPRESYYELLIKAAQYVNTSSVELIMTKTMRLQQITGGFIKMDSGEVLNISKDKLLMAKEFVEEYSKPLVIFCQYIPEIDMLKKELGKIKRGMKKKKLRIETITGKTKDKGKINKEFQDGKIDVLILQLKAGSVGLNLFKASKLMFYSWNHSYDDYVQAIARIKRNGQKEPWQIIHLIAQDTIDSKILKVIKSKGDLAKRLLR